MLEGFFLSVRAAKGHAYGYIWRFDNNSTKIDAQVLAAEQRPARAKIVQQFDLNNNFIAEYESAAAYSKIITNKYAEQRRIARAINEVCTGRAKSYCNFIWKYKSIN